MLESREKPHMLTSVRPDRSRVDQSRLVPGLHLSSCSAFRNCRLGQESIWTCHTLLLTLCCPLIPSRWKWENVLSWSDSRLQTSRWVQGRCRPAESRGMESGPQTMTRLTYEIFIGTRRKVWGSRYPFKHPPHPDCYAFVLKSWWTCVCVLEPSDKNSCLRPWLDLVMTMFWELSLVCIHTGP